MATSTTKSSIHGSLARSNCCLRLRCSPPPLSPLSLPLLATAYVEDYNLFLLLDFFFWKVQ